MSRWTTPFVVGELSASQICGTIASASRARVLPARDRLPQVHAVDVLHMK